MKKEKFKIKHKNRIFFGSRFIALLVVIVLLILSSTYAMFSGSLTITGTVTGNISEFTYYFNNSNNWSSVYAYIWKANPESVPVAWPGTAMTWDSTHNAYKVTFSASTDHDRIIFNDGSSNQTVDLKIDPYSINNYIYDPNRCI